jgi:integral membrane protein (TIGR01906 family)
MVPVLLAVAVGNALLLVFLLGGYFIDLIYALPGFPPAETVDGETRRQLAADGVAAIRPLGPGVEILREARLPGGAAAFNGREVAHMEDVRVVVFGFAWAWLAGLGLLLFAWLARGRLGGGEALRRSLGWAAGAALVLVAALGLVFLIAFEPVFEGFHAIFFSGDSWRFDSGDTLIQLYPEYFWVAAGTFVVALVVAQCLATWWRCRL